MTTHARSDESLKLHNVLERLKSFTQVEWFWKYGNYGSLATWLNKYSVLFSLIMTRWGLCFNFNMIAVNELLNVNETSRDFHYEANIKNHAYLASLDSNTLDSNETFPWRATNSHRSLIISFFRSAYNDENPYVSQSGYHMILHSSYEFPFYEEENHIWVGSEHFTTVDISPVVFEADESMAELTVEE
jgi:hypothetical protein